MIEQIDDKVAPEEEGSIALKQVEIHCPYGCGMEEADERGYCEHLLGFTNDRKVLEPLVPITRRAVDDNGQPTGESEKTGHYRVLGRKHQVKPVPGGSKFVNPQTRQLFNGTYHMAYRWVSWRVYHKDGKAALTPKPAAVTPTKAG